ncbi:MAG: FAD-dependent oxidoreductase [Gammaproteobacteria bacterium]|nr:FAD-dependent oxidoreductase [Gammaproteobacteria bacterium]
MEPIVIIGTGLAGYNLAKEIRKLDKAIPLRLITADGGESYSKPMLSNALAKGKSAGQLVLSTAEQMAAQLTAAIHTHTTAEAIEAHSKMLVTTSGEFPYSKLVLATGAEQIKPPLQGNAVNDVFSVNDLDDYARFRQALNSARHVGIIGPGLIGCEFANDLISAHKQVTVIGPSATPLDRLIPPMVGELLMRELQKAGVQWRPGVMATAVNKLNSRFQISLSDESQLEVDLVLSAVGLRPKLALARNAGLTVSRGIVVDRQLQTSQTDIYALGDCIEVQGLVLPYVLPLMNAARTLAKTLTGNPTPIVYPAMPVVVKTPAHPLVVSPPAAGSEGEWEIDLQDTGARALFRGSDGSLLGFVLTGDKVEEKAMLSKELPPVLK